MSHDPEPEQLRELERKLAKARQGQEKPAETGMSFSQGEVAWRMVIELVSGMIIGLGIGYGLDYVFSTMPLFLVIFVLLGFVAGIKTMMGTARDMAKMQENARNTKTQAEPPAKTEG